jgi:predicted flap endonuclease-1-like 5' DNA nuclease
MPRRKTESYFPPWLWFFLALPLGLIAAILWQRRQKVFFIHRPNRILRRPRYVEPDSIAIDTRPHYDMSQMEEAYHTEHAFELPLAPQNTTKPSGSLDHVDDLKIIEGIGPKIASLLNQQGITNFQELSITPIERLDEILVSANLRRISNPATWSEQARLADLGDWDGLKLLQSSLKAGQRKG